MRGRIGEEEGQKDKKGSKRDRGVNRCSEVKPSGGKLFFTEKGD